MVRDVPHQGVGHRVGQSRDRAEQADQRGEEHEGPEQREEPTDDDVGPEQPRAAGAQGVRERAERRRVGVVGPGSPGVVRGRTAAGGAPVAVGVGRRLGHTRPTRAGGLTRPIASAVELSNTPAASRESGGNYTAARDGSRMNVDIGNALASEARPGVSRDALDRLDERVARAHERVERGMADDEFGYASLNLPDRVDPAAIEDGVAPLADSAAVVTVGIGGSALGAATVSEALGPSDTTHRVLDNVDPAHTRAVLDALPLDETAVHVVSRSGTTAETLSTFLVVRDAMERAGEDWSADAEAEFKRPTIEQFERQSHPLYASARLWDDGIVDPRRSREVLALSLSAALNAPIPDTRFGVEA